MAVKIRLKRMGKIRSPHYRIVVADARTKRDGRPIEEVGHYHPKENPSFIQVDSERVQHWLNVGAQPSEPVLSLLKVTGDWQRFKGEPGAEGTLQQPAPRPDRQAAFAAASQQSAAASGALSRESKPAAEAAESKPAAEDSEPTSDAASSNES